MPDARVAAGSRLLAWLLAGGSSVLLLLIATGGPDCLEYLAWAHAFEHGDISWIDGDERSPLGIPLTQWSHGPGLFYAVPYLLPDLGLLDPAGRLAPARDFRLMGWIAAVALWGALAGLLRRVAGDDSRLLSFVLVSACAATHLGFYSFHHSSESLSLGCLAAIVAWLWIRRPLRWTDIAGIAALFGCLVLVRTHLALYLPLGHAVLAWRVRRERGTWRAALPAAAAAAVPPLLAAVQIAWVNRWMTGSFFRSTYSFGAGTFHSLDLGDPALAAVLAHPWHGLLVYHPLYGLALALLIAGLARSRGPERWLRAGVAVTFLVHLHVQASWYCWWLGLWSLGNRGLAVAAVLLVPWIARDLQDASPRARSAIAAGVVVCSWWSLLLMVQGHTNFVRWAELLGAQVTTARELLPWCPLYLTAAIAAFWLARRRELRLLAAATALLAAPLLDHAARLVAGSPNDPRPEAAAGVLRLTLLALAPVLAALDVPPPARPIPRFATASAVAVVCLFLGTGALFLRLALRTEDRVNAFGPRDLGGAVSFQLSEVEECYREYLRVPGFERRKAELRAFLEAARKPVLHSARGAPD